jgi:hypothetical protein
MKKVFILLFSWFSFLAGNSQNQAITLTFTGQDSATLNPVTLDSVAVHNITAGCDTTVYGPAPSLLLTFPSGIGEQMVKGNDPFVILPPFPNPFSGRTSVTIRLNQSGPLKLRLFDPMGKMVACHQADPGTGLHKFEIETSANPFLLLNVSAGYFSVAVKLINITNGPGGNTIIYRGTCPDYLKSGPLLPGFIFRKGDQLSYTTVKSGYYERVLYDNPAKDTAYIFSLSMIPTAPVVISAQVTGITPTTATGTGEVASDGGDTVTSRGFCWGTASGPTLAGPHTIDSSGTGMFESEITGLTPDVTYYGRAYAINSVDTSYGEDIIFATPGDGFYIKGAATAYSEFNENALMKITRNEVTQTEDPDLLELYIPVMAVAGGFSIVQVSGTAMMTYGPGPDFTTIYNGTSDEPKVPFQRGSFIEDTNRFTVPSEGMYHVAVYLNTDKVVVVPVHWGMIGYATLLGWATSVEMTESAFDLVSMSWTIDSLVLKSGDWKFRYSNGWKVELDTTIDLGGGFTGVKVNANFGEAVDSLVPGGANIICNDPGYYSCTMEYTLGSGYQATLEKTGLLPPTNWTGVVCDAVGTGISLDNPTAAPDTSNWNWGNQMLGDNGGIPAVSGLVYTWTWTEIIIEAYEGFKVRTLNGVPSPLNGMYFDAGYSDLNVAASAPEIIDSGGNLMATVKGSYTITLHIDAGNGDQRELIIIKN